jgi:hypothetical protein
MRRCQGARRAGSAQVGQGRRGEVRTWGKDEDEEEGMYDTWDPLME